MLSLVLLVLIGALQEGICLCSLLRNRCFGKGCYARKVTLALTLAAFYSTRVLLEMVKIQLEDVIDNVTLGSYFLIIT